MAIGRLNIGLTGVQPGGLAKVIPSSVAVGSGSGSVDTNGNVSFSGASSVSLNGCFSSTYNNYRIYFEITAVSATIEYYFRMRTGSTDLSTSGAYKNGILEYGGVSTSGNFSNQGTTATASRIGYFDTGSSPNTALTILDLTFPFQTRRTISQYRHTRHQITSAVGVFGEIGHGIVDNDISYESITFLTNGGGNFSGTIRVYGYAN